MSESTPEEIAQVVAEQLEVIRTTKAKLHRAMEAEREGARNRQLAEAEIRNAYIVIAHLLRGSAVGDEFIEVFRSIKR